MLRPDEVGRVVEIDKVAGADIDGADAEARLTGVDAVVDKALERRPEKLRVIKARGSSVPAGLSQGEAGGGRRTRLRQSVAEIAPAFCEAACQVAFWEQGIEAIAQSDSGLAVMPSQKALSFATRWSGALLAMMAALIAPIEIPATQSGWISASASAA